MTVQLTCPHCQFTKLVPRNKIPPGVEWATCPCCRRKFQFTVPEGDWQGSPEMTATPSIPISGSETTTESAHEKSEPVFGAKRPPWEKRSEIGLWQGVYQTSRKVLFSPDRFFRGMIHRAGLTEPLAFGLLVGGLGILLGLFWRTLSKPANLLAYTEHVFGQLALGILFIITLFFVLVLVIGLLFLYSGILHLLLTLLKAGQNGFEATFRVVAYSQAAQIWAVVPFLGGMVAGFWQLVIQIVGLKEIHHTSYARVITAYLIPVFLMIFMAVGLLLTGFLFFSRS